MPLSPQSIMWCQSSKGAPSDLSVVVVEEEKRDSGSQERRKKEEEV